MVEPSFSHANWTITSELMHTGARAREQKYIYISIYISLCMKTFLKTGVYIYIYIYIYMYIYIHPFSKRFS